MSLLRRLTSRELIRQYASVIEQVLMSGSNMLVSIVVLKVGDVAQFGVYSFVFVLSTLFSGIFGTLLHRQMMLEIASEDEAAQRRVFLATLALELAGILAFLVLLTLLMAGLSRWFGFNVASHRDIAMAGALYASLFVIFDNFKQYLYTTGNQVYSLRSTAIYVAVQLTLLAALVLFVEVHYVVEAAYVALSISLLVSLTCNRLCLKSLSNAQWLNWGHALQVLKGYFQQGRFSLLGMSITWAQNQSMNPFLMLISGPTVAGYFSVGRLLVMPMAVVSQGLVNSSTPTLRRLYKSGGTAELPGKINSYLKKTSLFSALYIAALVVGHLTGLLPRFVPDYGQVQWFLLVWIALVSCSIFRFWRGQYFVVSMEFKFLLNVSIIALLVTVSGMLLFGLGLNSIQLALMSVIAGELTAITLYHRKQQAERQV